MKRRCAILNDYQNVALQLADWSMLDSDVDVTVFDRHLGDDDGNAAALRDFDIICIMRERTPFRRSLLEKLPKLRLLVTTAPRNPSIDLVAARELGVTVCGTGVFNHPTAELVFGLMLALCRHLIQEDAAIRGNGRWQNTVGVDLMGKTIGVIGLGRLGTQVAQIGQAFGMKAIAWSQNLTAERCAEVGATLVTKDQLLSQADFVVVCVNFSARTTGLIGAREFGLMKSSAYLINAARSPIVESAALIDALRSGRIAGAGIDVYDQEPLSPNDPMRTLPNTVLTPHLGYVTEDNYRTFFRDTVEDIRAWLDGKTIREVDPTIQIDRSK